MLAYYKSNLQFIFLLLIWLLVGIYAGNVIFLLLPISMILLKQKYRIEELILGYLFILILSDSLEPSLLFAKSIKNVYITLLAIFFFLDLKSFKPYNKLFLIFGFFFIFSVITMLTSVNETFFLTSLQKTISYFLTFLIIPNYILLIYREKGDDFLRSITYFLVTGLFLGVAFKFFAHDLAYIQGGRYRGIMGNPNGMGIVAVLFFIIFFIFDSTKPILFTKNEKIFFYCIIFFTIYATGSRNAIIAIVIFYLLQKFYKISPFLGFILFLLLIFVVEIISNNLISILASIGLNDLFRINTIDNGSGRYIAWNFAWIQIQNNLFIGKGFGYNEFYMRQHYGELSKLGHQGGIHNSFLTFWMDQGLVGLLLYLQAFVYLFLKAAKKTKFALPIMFTIAFTAIFESWLVGSLSAFAFLSVFIFTLLNDDEILFDKIENKEVQPEIQLEP